VYTGPALLLKRGAARDHYGTSAFLIIQDLEREGLADIVGTLFSTSDVNMRPGTETYYAAYRNLEPSFYLPLDLSVYCYSGAEGIADCVKPQRRITIRKRGKMSDSVLHRQEKSIDNV